MKCTQRLYLTADRMKVVAEGDKKAATLYAIPGDEIPQSAVDRFGFVDGHLRGFDPNAEVKEDKDGSDKEQKSGSDKEQKSGGDKAESGAGQAPAGSGGSGA